MIKGNFQHFGESKTVSTFDLEKTVLQKVDENPDTDCRRIIFQKETILEPCHHVGKSENFKKFNSTGTA